MSNWMIFMEWASRAVLLVLIGLSVWSVAIMRDRQQAFKAARQPLEPEQLREWLQADQREQVKDWLARSQTVLAGTLRAAISSPGHTDAVEKTVKSYLSRERLRLERGITVLATLGSNAPFIGLFGTVLGIIQAFAALSGSNPTASGTGTIMSGISEALVATAVGLFVAIPAVVAFNVYARRLRVILVECESLKDLYLARMPKGGA